MIPSRLVWSALAVSGVTLGVLSQSITAHRMAPFLLPGLALTIAVLAGVSLADSALRAVRSRTKPRAPVPSLLVALAAAITASCTSRRG